MVSESLTDPQGIALDLLNNTMFITDTGSGQIVKADMGYKLMKAPILTNQSYFQARARAQWLQLCYHNERCACHPIHVQQVVVKTFESDVGIEHVREPYAIVYDYPNQLIYWTDAAYGMLIYADVFGHDGAIEPTYVLSLGKRSSPRGIALDGGNGVPNKVEAYECNGHGYCGGFDDHFKCTCFDGYFGSCNETTCPSGPAWFDEPGLVDTAHAPAECSNAGVCNRGSGACDCQPGFEGPACELMSCPYDNVTELTCSGHGRCLTMRQLALAAHSKGDATSVVYGSAQRNASAAWDADHIQGCLCDERGYIGDTQHNLTKWFGYDCSLHSCPTGDYQRTTNQSFEEQDIRCDATSGSLVRHENLPRKNSALLTP